MRHLISRVLRPVAVLATAAVITTTLTAPAQAAGPDDRGARWLQRQLTDGVIHNDQYDFNDYGLTADVAFALDAIGGHRSAVDEIADALAPHVDSWTTGVDFGSSDVYAGSVAKAVVLAQTAERDPRSFGDVNLVKRLAARVSKTAPYAGRIEDRGDVDYANTIGQAFAVLGLAAAGSAKAGPARKFLLKQQCPGGYFRLDFSDKDRKRQGCDTGDNTLTAPDTDVTALSVILLQALPSKGKKVRGTIRDAVSWLKSAQRKNGSFADRPGTDKPAFNTNSTGLAAWALGDTGSCRAAAKSARWVRKLQVGGDVSGTPLAGEKGAVAYDRAAMKAGETDGITVETRDQWRRATSQAAPGLTFTSVRRCRR